MDHPIFGLILKGPYIVIAISVVLLRGFYAAAVSC
jgi:hypothetical protein